MSYISLDAVPIGAFVQRSVIISSKFRAPYITFKALWPIIILYTLNCTSSKLEKHQATCAATPISARKKNPGNYGTTG